MAAIGDIYRVTTFGSYLNQEVLNVFFYRLDTLTELSHTPANWADEYATDFETNVMAHLCDAYTVNLIRWENLTDGVEIIDHSTSLVGGNPGAPMPSSVALGVILRRQTKTTRNGFKRFVGMFEEQMDGNAHQLASGDINDIEDFCGTVNLYTDYDGQGNDVQLGHVIVGRTLNGQGVYEIDLTRVNNVLTAQVKSNVTTQNTRKP